jgi:hypothetical protein
MVEKLLIGGIVFTLNFWGVTALYHYLDLSIIDAWYSYPLLASQALFIGLILFLLGGKKNEKSRLR